MQVCRFIYLDLTIEIATKACERIKKSRPPLLMEENNLNHIIPGSIENDMETLKDADWVVEAVVERIDIKKTLYSQIDKLRKPGALSLIKYIFYPSEGFDRGYVERNERSFLYYTFF